MEKVYSLETNGAAPVAALPAMLQVVQVKQAVEKQLQFAQISVGS
jgi:hypothetical protein